MPLLLVLNGTTMLPDPLATTFLMSRSAYVAQSYRKDQISLTFMSRIPRNAR